MAQVRRSDVSRSVCVIALSLSLLTMGRLAMSQLPTATILGVVKDSTGAVIPGAGITVRTSSNTPARRADSSIASAVFLM